MWGNSILVEKHDHFKNLPQNQQDISTNLEQLQHSCVKGTTSSCNNFLPFEKIIRPILFHS